MGLQLASGPETPIDGKLIEQARDFGSRRIQPFAESWEQGHASHTETLRAAAGLVAPLLVPEALGGKGATFTAFTCVLGELAKFDVGFSCALAVHCNAVFSLARGTNDRIRDRYLQRMMSGEAIGAFLLTEPGVGSDATEIVASAHRDDDAYVLSGEKAWITNAKIADYLAVFVQTDPGSRSKGIAAFAVDAGAEGIEFGAAYDLLGSHAMGACGATLRNCRVPAEDMIAPPREGFKRAMRGIDVARIGVGAICNGVLEAGLETALDYAEARVAFGQPISRHQGQQWKLCEIATQLEASRQLTFRATAMFDREEDTTVIAAHVKKFTARSVFDGLASAMQIMGANGLKRDYPLARQLSGCRVTEFMDGTSDIQNIVIGRALTSQIKS